jgi:hypothetical protein
MGVALVGGALALTLVLHGIDLISGRKIREETPTSILLLVGLIFTVQAIYITTLADMLIFSGLGLRGLSLGADPNPTGAVVHSPTFQQTVINRLHLGSLLLGFIAGVLGLFKFRLGRNGLGFIALGGLLTFLSLLSLPISVGGIDRNIFLIEPILFGLIVVCAFRLTDELSWRHLQIPVIVILVVVVLAQAVAWPAAPDQPEKGRYFLTDEEVDAKEWTVEYVGRTVWMDVYYGDEVVDIPEAAESGDRRYQRPPGRQPYLLNEELYNATLPEKGYEHVALRHDVETYRLLKYFYRLTWNLHEVMRQEYSIIYDNGGVSVYHNDTRV